MAYDFSGYATKHNIRCSDGRTIMPDAFKECDGKTVPLVWQHVHDDVDNVLGHAELECRPDGVYAYCTCNSTPKGQNAKELVKHGDICALSIYANKLQQVGQNVMHGVIREVSLVLAGANPGATIDNLAFAHADGSKAIIEDEACMSFVDESFKIIMHSDDDEFDEDEAEETIGEIMDTMTDKQKDAVYTLVGNLLEDQEDDEDLEHSDIDIEDLTEEQEEALAEILDILASGEELPEDLEEIFDTFTDEQKDIIYDIVESDDEDDEDDDEDEDYEDSDDGDGEEGEGLQHSDINEPIQDILDTLDDDQYEAYEDILHSAMYGDPIPEGTDELFHTFSTKQKTAVFAMLGMEAGDGYLAHADDDEETIKDILDELDDEQQDALDEIIDAIQAGKQVDPEIAEIFDTFTDRQKQAVYGLVGTAAEAAGEMQHADEDEIEEILSGMDEEQLAAVEAILTAVENGEDSVAAEVKDIVDGMTDEQKQTVQELIEAAQEEDSEDESDEEMEHSDFEGELMNYNIFETDEYGENTLSHDDMKAIFADAPRYGSLKEAVLQHGITDIEVLFPEVQAVNKAPYQIARRMEWVSVVLNGVHKTPFARIKSTAVNLTEEQARAKGYIKGRKKIEEQISALKRVTTPQTVYKLQKLDRDDIIDITDFDVVAFMKQEMRMMLDEEIARAILVGDGRVGSDPEKIFPDHIRPVWSDDEMYTIHKVIATADATDYTKMIDEVVRARKSYKGSGNPVMFIGPDILTEMRLLKDNDSRFRYESDSKLAEAMRVSKIHEVELFDELTRTVDGKDRKLVAIILNLSDYTVGANKGGEVTMFDDFDIDYNKMAYLIETRISGALTMPKSAIAIEIQTTTDSTPEVKYKKVLSPVVADIDDYYEQDEYGRYIKTLDVAIVTGKTYYEVDED